MSRTLLRWSLRGRRLLESLLSCANAPNGPYPCRTGHLEGASGSFKIKMGRLLNALVQMIHEVLEKVTSKEVMDFHFNRLEFIANEGERSTRLCIC
ncbi:unnamed protein product [Pleuronectes platessa]|uniref:Uncharacterized protein n=1 Tax=Pleuronectes platessa TaxID=8262 RepID=A0A9N7UAU1_PLEPL|nr:unnamed protein product [Pleuronectes platessa]